MFYKKVDKVSSTCIFVARSADKQQQFTAYQNNVDSNNGTDDSNIMILPVWGFTKFIDLSKKVGYGRGAKNLMNLFTDLNKAYEDSDDMPDYFSTDSASGSRSLEIYQVGNYKAVLVDDYDALVKTEWETFKFSQMLKQTAEAIKKNYNKSVGDKHFSFILFKLDAGKTQHPIGYIHSVLPDNSIFIPTYHSHDDGNVNSADWDHTIFSTGEMRYDATEIVRPEYSAEILTRLQRAVFEFEGDPKRLIVTGNNSTVIPNCDLISGHRMNRFTNIVKKYGFPNHQTQVGNAVFMLYSDQPYSEYDGRRKRYQWGDILLTIGKVKNNYGKVVTWWHRRGDHKNGVAVDIGVDYCVIDTRGQGIKLEQVQFTDP